MRIRVVEGTETNERYNARIVGEYSNSAPRLVNQAQNLRAPQGRYSDFFASSAFAVNNAELSH